MPYVKKARTPFGKPLEDIARVRGLFADRRVMRGPALAYVVGA